MRGTSLRLAPVLLQRAPGLPVVHPFLDIFPFVPHVLSFAEPQFHFDVVPKEVYAQRNEGKTARLYGLSQSADFTLVHQELPAPPGSVVVAVPLGILSNMCPDEEELTVDQAGIGVGQSNAACSAGLDLRSDQGDAGLERLEDVEVVPGFLVLSKRSHRSYTLIMALTTPSA
jgi:hypothetical protein